MSRHEQALRAQWMDSLLVFLLVITVGSVCSVLVLRDLGRYWEGVGKQLEGVGARPPATPTPRAADERGRDQ